MKRDRLSPRERMWFAAIAATLIGSGTLLHPFLDPTVEDQVRRFVFLAGFTGVLLSLISVPLQWLVNRATSSDSIGVLYVGAAGATLAIVLYGFKLGLDFGHWLFEYELPAV